MAKAYPIEKKNQVLARILSKEITVAQAHKEYGIAESCLHNWLRSVKEASSVKRTVPDAIPLPRGMTFRQALAADGYCRESGFDSPATGKFCRAKGITLEELKAFSTWLDSHDGDVVLTATARAREQELITKVSELSQAHRDQRKELERKEKALAETAALLVLSKKAQAIWGDREK
jgi:hypothetical protein